MTRRSFLAGLALAACIGGSPKVAQVSGIVVERWDAASQCWVALYPQPVDLLNECGVMFPVYQMLPAVYEVRPVA